MLGAPLVLHTGEAAQAAPERLLCVRWTSRRYRRALVRFHHQGGQRTGDAPGRGAQLHRGRERRPGESAAQGRHRALRERAARARGHEEVRRLGDVQQVLRQPGAAAVPRAPDRRAGRRRGPQGQARGLLLPEAAQQSRRLVPLHLLRPPPEDGEGGHQALPHVLGPGRQRHPGSVEGLPAAPRHRLGRTAGGPARTGVAAHLRAAARLRRLRDVPVAGLGGLHAQGASLQGRAEGAAGRPRLPGEHPRLGAERRPLLLREPVHGAQAGEAGRGDAGRGLRRELHRLQVGVVLGQGAHHPARPDRRHP